MSNSNSESFRDHLGNQTKKGKRLWLYPKIIKGKYYKYRTYLSWVYFAFFFIAPFIKINGNPLLLLNVLERKFVILGQPFWPQDFHLLVFLILSFVVFIILFTVVFGRVFCGWACPQTIFMEMLFRKIETAIEGNPSKRKKLDAMPWNREKIMKKGLKHAAFFGMSFLIANTFLAYIIGVEELIAKITGPFMENAWTLVGLLVFTFVFYLVFSKVRELVCIMICPYGRLQGVMLDQNSMVVAYDFERGEPRGKIRKNEDQAQKGDCVDCGLCVDVCPTGIDIRNGTQLECVNCTACMDACDGVMDKIKKPKGLIRIDSITNIKEKIGFRFTPRIISYMVLMGVLLSVFVALLATRTDIEAHILRTRGKSYFPEGDLITNVYNFTLVNKTFDDKNLTFELKDPNAELVLVDMSGKLEANSEKKTIFMIKKKRDLLTDRSTKMEIDMYADGEKLKTLKTNFLGPFK
jgi:cytochrome c oxidase accessory protein FixG